MNTGIATPHPGEFLRTEVVEPLGLDIDSVADILFVERDILAEFLQGKIALEPDMAWRWEQAFGVNMDGILRMQAAYDASRMRSLSPRPDIRPYLPAHALVRRIETGKLKRHIIKCNE